MKRKEREAPQESPRARKKVMRAPATSLSCASTCLEHTGMGALQKTPAPARLSPGGLPVPVVCARLRPHARVTVTRPSPSCPTV